MAGKIENFGGERRGGLKGGTNSGKKPVKQVNEIRVGGEVSSNGIGKSQKSTTRKTAPAKTAHRRRNMTCATQRIGGH